MSNMLIAAPREYGIAPIWRVSTADAMVYTRIVQPGIRKKYHYVPGERTLFRVEGTIIPKVWKTAVLVALLTLALCFARPGVLPTKSALPAAP